MTDMVFFRILNSGNHIITMCCPEDRVAVSYFISMFDDSDSVIEYKIIASNGALLAPCHFGFGEWACSKKWVQFFSHEGTNTDTN